MIILTTTDTLEIVTTTAATLNYNINYVDHTSTTAVPGRSFGSISSITTTTVLTAPAASTTRQIRSITILNVSATSNNITVQLDVSGTNTALTDAEIATGEGFNFTDNEGWYSLDSVGRRRIVQNQTINAGYTLPLFKAGAAMEGPGWLHSHHAANGSPGAWAPGTPGLTGRATNGTAAADAGCIPVRTPAAGAAHLIDYSVAATVASGHYLFDYLWINSGIVVTTTTAQAISSVAFPARDINGTAAGLGYEIGLLAVANLGNAGAITNTTVSYTNSSGVAGRTATLAVPATVLAGTLVPFQLAAGDVGVQSIQSITLGTTYTSGTMSLVVFRRIAAAPATLINTLGSTNLTASGGSVRLYNGVCLIPVQMASAATATNVNGIVTIVEK